MKPITDEQLSAYADGAADAATAAAVDRALAGDAELRARLERLRANDLLLAEAIDARLGGVPDRLQALASGQVAVARVHPQRGAANGMRRLAMAASIALAVAFGFALDRLVAEAPGNSEIALGTAGLAADGGLARVMSTAYSGTPGATAAGRVVVELSFQASDGSLCRKFRIEHETQSDVGVACRSGKLWLMKGWSAGAAAGPRSGFETASGPADASIDAVIDRLGMRNSLDRAGETKAINSGWNAGKR